MGEVNVADALFRFCCFQSWLKYAKRCQACARPSLGKGEEMT